MEPAGTLAPAPKIDGGKRCRYCLQQAVLTGFGEQGYPYRRDYGYTWVCEPCEAYVGCHDGTTKALGGLAKFELRELRKAAHAAFDPMWKDATPKGPARRKAYAWLAEQLGIEFKRCHIAHMREEECRRVLAICAAQGAQQ